MRVLRFAALLSCLTTPALADDPAPTAYPPGADSLVSAVSALTSAEDKEIGLWRSSQRYGVIRKEFIKALVNSKGNGSVGCVRFARNLNRRGFIPAA